MVILNENVDVTIATANTQQILTNTSETQTQTHVKITPADSHVVLPTVA